MYVLGTITQSANIQFPFSFTDNPLTMGEVSEAINDLKPKNSLDFEGILTNFIKKCIVFTETIVLYI